MGSASSRACTTARQTMAPTGQTRSGASMRCGPYNPKICLGTHCATCLNVTDHGPLSLR